MDVYWLEQSVDDVPLEDWWLSGNERTRLAGLRFPKRRADWRLGRWTAKCALAAYLEPAGECAPLAEWELRPGPLGAPEAFFHQRPMALAISLSHSHGRALCAVAPPGAEIGCDLEAVEPRSAAFLADYFTVEERLLADRAPPANRDRLVTLLWSAKESALKALGCGLRLDTRSVHGVPTGFGAAPAGQWRALSVATGATTYGGWWREARHIVRTVVAEPPPLRLLALRADPALAAAPDGAAHLWGSHPAAACCDARGEA
ncbi:MAG TPA: 4'-phosphopantetheinyl transferase superfamily protein [Bryobacteraceae bacterium]|nr:4'-phosphopantetheinyl transferase superfamily protein [Bryobacteraceae bacterium]